METSWHWLTSPTHSSQAGFEHKRANKVEAIALRPELWRLELKTCWVEFIIRVFISSEIQSLFLLMSLGFYFLDF